MKKEDARKNRVRAKLREVSEKPRLSIFRSNMHIYAQIVDDLKGANAGRSFRKGFKSERKILKNG